MKKLSKKVKREAYLRALKKFANSEFAHGFRDFYYFKNCLCYFIAKESPNFSKVHFGICNTKEFDEFELFNSGNYLASEPWFPQTIEGFYIRQTVLCFCIAMCK